MQRASGLAGRRWDFKWDFPAWYQRFEHAVILVLTVLTAFIIALAVFNLAVKILVIMIALLAIVGKLVALDLVAAEAPQIIALAVAILALGGVHWRIRDQDRRDSDAAMRVPAGVRNTSEGGDNDDEEARQRRVACISRPYVEDA
jgi:hypothetical protein